MSAVLVGAPDRDHILGDLGPDGIRRYKTRCKVLIDSHNQPDYEDASTLELFDDVIAVETSKTLKGAGQATVTLTPSLNYLNVIFPNDYINIYFDLGDGSGWTRTFFGFVDRIEESYLVEASGAPKTFFRLICTDFYKAFDRTMIYFNPQLAGRREFVSYDFNAINVGGLALLTKGIVAGGSPPDIISNVIQLLIGFGTQFILPKSYQPGDVQRKLREARAEIVYGQLSNESLDLLRSINGGYRRLREDANAEAAATVSNYEVGNKASEEARLKAIATELGMDPSKQSDLDTLSSKSDSTLIKLLSDKKISDQLTLDASAKGKVGLVGSVEAQNTANIAILDSNVSDKSSLSDIIDTFTFIERRSIDGYMFGQPVWQRQGSLLSILRSFSNEAVNELFFDLRPMSTAPGLNALTLAPIEGSFATVADDKRGNLSDESSQDGVTYLPAVVMREYPFSTIEGLDLRNVQLQLTEDPDGAKANIGLLYFGAIFCDKPNIPGRHVITHPNLNIADKALGESKTLGAKHLDVAVISEEEVKSSSLGRSDNDHFNLFEFWSDNVLGTDQKFYLRDFLPIITPIQLLRNGIRVRTITTRAARFSLAAIRNLRTEDFEKATKAAEAAQEGETERTVVANKDIQPPVISDPALVRYINSSNQANWGYRPKAAIGSYVFHQGIDICKRPLHLIEKAGRSTSERIPIYAIADGEIVISAPEGVYTGYGNVVVIKHYFEAIGYRYSVYAHLDEIVVGYAKGIRSAQRNTRRRWCAKGGKTPGTRGGSKPAIPIKRGTKIGYMGNSGFSAAPGTRFHLHFEIDRHFPPRNDKVTNRIPIAGTNYDQNFAPPYTDGFDPTGTSTSQMVAADQRSCDPVSFFASQGIDLPAYINGFASASPEDFDAREPDDIDLGDNSPEETENKAKEDVEEEKGKKFDEDTPSAVYDRDSVDTASTRTQIIRWALLQDHWYQHNLEYLSGRIDMRGAPEIRVGYRLDIKERNMSFYVEGVNHKWAFPDSMSTNLAVTRGQPNNPYPLYVYPNSASLKTPETQRRTSGSRLATYFLTPDPVAIRRSLFIRNGSTETGGLVTFMGGMKQATDGRPNVTDTLAVDTLDEETMLHAGYNEIVIPAGSYKYSEALEEDEDLTNIEEELGIRAPISGADSRPSVTESEEE